MTLGQVPVIRDSSFHCNISTRDDHDPYQFNKIRYVKVIIPPCHTVTSIVMALLLARVPDHSGDIHISVPRYHILIAQNLVDQDLALSYLFLKKNSLIV